MLRIGQNGFVILIKMSKDSRRRIMIRHR